MTTEIKNILDNNLWAERVLKKHIKLYDMILNYNINFNNINFVQKVYNYYYNITNLPLCKCGKPVKFQNKKYNTFCSINCSNLNNVDNRQKTMLEKYGYISSFSDPIVCDKIKNTMIKKYGVPCPFSSKEINDRKIKTVSEKYGTNNISKLNNIREKISVTKLNYSEKLKNDINLKRDNTNLKKYGVKNVMQSDDVKSKLADNNLEKYGVVYPIQLDFFKNKQKNTIGENTFLKYKVKIPNEYDIINFDNKEFIILHKCCNTTFSINRSFLYDRLYNNIILCTNCKPINSLSSSHEIELQQFLTSLNVDFLKNDRKILSGKELDIYI